MPVCACVHDGRVARAWAGAGGRRRGKELKAVRIGGGVDVVAKIIALFDEVIGLRGWSLANAEQTRKLNFLSIHLREALLTGKLRLSIET